jgi:hypothetical protein
VTVRRQRITANRLELAAEGLTARDRAVLDTLAIVGVASTGQVARTCCWGFTTDTAMRLARRSLERLRRDGLARRFDDRAWDRRQGAPGYVHALSGAGLRLADGESAPGVGQRRAWRPSYQFLTHRLGITELYVRLIELERTGGPRMREFAPEASAARAFHGPGGKSRFVRPDALVRLGVGDTEVSHFVEIDLGTESPATILRKCQAYRAYELTGDETRHYGVFPGVLFIVRDAKRGRTIATVIGRLDANGRELFAVATGDEAIRVLARVDVPTVADRAPPELPGPMVGPVTPPH